MPTVHFQGRHTHCEEGDCLRDVLCDVGASPHNGAACWLNCKGFGSCGTCAVEVRGPLTERTAMERWRLGFPPHDGSQRLRLACQVRVLGDLEVVKHPGFWGQEFPEPTR